METAPPGRLGLTSVGSAASSSGTCASAPAGVSRSTLVWPLLVAVLLTLALITLPRLPIGSDDDSSWSAVLGYAHQHGLQFGTDIAFTYGPLGFLVTPYQSPQAPLLRFGSDVLLSFLCIAGLCLALWRLAPAWRWPALIIFLFFAGNAEPRTELLLNIGLLSWAILCLVHSSWRAAIAGWVLVGLSVFAALAKVTYLFIAPVGLAAVAGVFWLGGRRRLAWSLWGGFLLGLASAWMLLGQSLAHLVPFLINALTLSSDYDKTMQTRDFSTLTWTALLMLASASGALVLHLWPRRQQRESHSRWRSRAILFWLSAWLFLIWKHGFVRAGRDHTEIFLSCVPMMGLLLDTLPAPLSPLRYWARGFAVVCCLLAAFGWQWLLGGDPKNCLVEPFKLAGEHVQALVHPHARAERLRELQTAEKLSMQLPRLREKVLHSTVDVFGFNQSFAVMNGFNYRPRPVFQSYAAYSARLMRLNEQFYLSPNAPDFVLFRLNPIDDRFPPLEDALVFRELLRNYTPADAEGPFLLLRSKQLNPPPPRLELVYEGMVHPGELIDLRGYSTNDLWLEVSLEPSLAGRARTFFYQAARVQLGVWCASGASLRMAKFRAPAPMLAAGFLASPMVLDNQDMLDLYTGAAITRPVAYSVELEPGSRQCWKDEIRFRIYQVRDRLGRCAAPELSRLLKYPGFDQAPAAIVSPRQAIIQVGGKPALFLPPGSYMRFAAPNGAKRVKGSFGFAPAAYTLGGATEGAEFRIEEELPDGRMQVLGSHVLQPCANPADRGLKSFDIECPGTGDRQLLFRIVPIGAEHPAWDLTCWADIGFR